MKTPCAAILLLVSAAGPLQAQQSVAPEWSQTSVVSPVLEDLYFERVHLHDGIRSGAITSLAQDSVGFLWVGTRNGLLRYNGSTFEAFGEDPRENASLSSQWVEALHVDHEGTLWVGTHGGGLNRFDVGSETFVAYRHDPADPSTISGDIVTAIANDGAGGLWVGTHSGLNQMDRDAQRFQRYTHEPADTASLSNNYVRSVLVDRRGSVWIATGRTFESESTPGTGGLNRFEPATGRFTRFLHDPADPATLINNNVQALLEDASGTVWVGTMGNVLHRLDPRSGMLERLVHDGQSPGRMVPDRRSALPSSCYAEICGVITLLHEDADGTIWIGASGVGLFRFDPRANVVSVHRNADGAGLGRLSQTIVTNDGTRWVGGIDSAALIRVVQASEHVPHFVHDPANPNSLSHNNVRGIYADAAGSVWVATDGGGVNRFDPGTGTFTHYRHDPANLQSLSSNSVFSISEDRSGMLWIGTWDNGLNQFDKATGLVTRYLHDPHDPKSLSAHSVTQVLEDRAGALWVATWGGGLNRLDELDEKFHQFRHDDDDDYSVFDRIYFLHEDARGTLWIGGFGGLQMYEPETSAFVRFASFYGHFHLGEDESGQLWIIDDVSGLRLLKPDEGRTIQHGPPQRLPGTEIGAAVEDHTGRLWVTTFDGEAGAPTSGNLARFDLDGTSFRVFERADGFPNIPFNEMSAAVDRNGILYFGGPHGFIAVDPSRLEEPSVPKVVLTGLLLFNNAVAPGHGMPLMAPLYRERQLRFTHAQHDFTLSYDAIDFRSRAPLRFQYMLDGHDEDWVEARMQRSARYSRLAPGRYTFLVRASRQGEQWPEHATSIAVVVLPPWWRSYWAYGLYALALAGGLSVLAMFQRRRMVQRSRIERARELEALNEQLRAHEEQLERQNSTLAMQAARLSEMDEVRTRFFANISHEFRTPLTLILGPLHKALTSGNASFERDEIRLMQRNAKRLLRLISELLDLSKLEAGAMTLVPRRANIVSFARRLVLGFASLSEHLGVSLSFFATSNRIETAFDEHALEKVIANLLHNAFKFSHTGGAVRVTVSEVADVVEIAVRDNGDGIPSHEVSRVFDRFHQADGPSANRHSGTGIGLSIAKEFVELHGGSISVDSELGFGSKFTVRLPLVAPGFGDAVDDAEMNAALESEFDWRELEPGWTGARNGVPCGTAAGPEHAPLILIVEDNADMRTYLRSSLSRIYRMQEACDGEEGLRQAREHNPDLVISDVMMPRLDGFELCRSIKSDRSLSHIPVVLLTAKADEASRIEGLGTGADDYLNKPFSLEELIIRVENLVEIRRRLRERFEGLVRVGPSEIQVDSIDARFVRDLRDVIEAEMGDSMFGVERLAEELNLSRRQLHRRVRETIGMSPGGYIRMMRLERAAQLLQKKAGRVSEVSYAVGFRDPRYFSRLYRQTFCRPPSLEVGVDSR